MNKFNTLSDLLGTPIADKFVLVRSDLNVPLAPDGSISDYGRIDASLPTLSALSNAGAKIVIISHLGRPEGNYDSKYTLRPVAQALGERLNRAVHFATDTIGQDALSQVKGLLPKDLLLLENVRFDSREISKNNADRNALAKALVDIVGNDAVFVSDGFGVVHRKQASVYDIGLKLPAYAGYLVEKEYSVLSDLKTEPQRPYAVVLGGSKVSDKIGVIQALAPKVDTLIIVGGMVFTFFAALGVQIGSSLVEESHIASAKNLLDRYGDIIKLPLDIVIADKFAADAQHKVVANNQIPDGWMGLDIGPESVKFFTELLRQAKTIFWNGPAGVFEFPAFSQGTKGIAEAIIAAKRNNNAFTVVGGGDSAAAVRALGLDEEGFTHISTGGGASLEFLEGAVMPGLSVLGNYE